MNRLGGPLRWLRALACIACIASIGGCVRLPEPVLRIGTNV